MHLQDYLYSTDPSCRLILSENVVGSHATSGDICENPERLWSVWWMPLLQLQEIKSVTILASFLKAAQIELFSRVWKINILHMLIF